MNPSLAVKSFIVNNKGELLIIKRDSNDVHCAGNWEIPGGRLDPGEDPFEGLKRETKEAVCVADADSMAHFNAVGALYYLAYNSHKLSIEHANKWLREKLERSWNKLSDAGKEIIEPKYLAALELI